MLEKHHREPYLRPIPAHSETAFEALLGALPSPRPPLILDAGCGTGQSSLRLKAKYPAHWVIGVDRSELRLRKVEDPAPEGLIWLRADLVDLFRQLARAEIRCEAVYLFYPNPYPKPGHLARRWHGHPVFFDLLKLTDTLVLRTNWEVYAKEWEAALDWAGWEAAREQLPDAEAPVSRFEAKYRSSGHTLWEVRAKKPQIDPTR